MNGKFGLSGGYLNNDGRYHAEGSISIPLSHDLGFQVDTAAGGTDSGFIGGIGGHLFMRDPSSYLFGVFGSYSAIDKIDIGRIGAEAHFYLDQVSFEGLIGYEDADITGNKAFAVADLAFYPSDNLRLKAGYHFFQDRSFGAFGLEYQTGLFSGMVQGPVSFFAKARFGEKSDDSIWAGFKIYFGASDKSLIARHREDDPANTLLELLTDVKKPSSAAPRPE
jgi:hypothetical protein